MPRRIVQVNAIQDLSPLDEPILPVGPLFLSFRRAAYLAIALALAGSLAAFLRGPVLAVLPGGFPITPGILLGTMTAGILLALAFQEPKALSPEAQLLLAALSPAERKKRGKEEGVEGYVLKADPDLGVADVEVIGVAVDPSTGKPFPRVIIDVSGRAYEAETSPSGRYRLRIELPRGLYEIRVVAPDSSVELRRLKVSIV